MDRLQEVLSFTMDAHERIKDLKTQIKYHNQKYYEKDAPEISDHEYDILLRELKALEREHSELATPDSPTQHVGGKAKREMGKMIRHNVPMLSLDDKFTREEVSEFVSKMKRELGNPVFIVEPKVDGLSAALRFRAGYFALGMTRGDGINYGEDITENLSMIKTVPHEIAEKIPYLEVRGEVYMDNETFERVNERQAEIGGKIFANPRNCAAGTMRQLDPNVVAERNLSIIIFNLQAVEGKVFVSHSETLDWLSQQGFHVSKYYKCNTEEEVWNAICKIGEKREELPFGIDGATVKIEDLASRKMLGASYKFPRWAVCYKYPAQGKGTVLDNVRWQVSRLGSLTPVGLFDQHPLELCGTKVTKATLHNADIARKFSLQSTVLVIKSGDVIPSISGILKDSGMERIKPPSVCPSCGSPVEYRAPSVYCTGTNCISQDIERVVHFASKSGMDVRGLGDGIIEDLVNAGKVKRPVDLFYLKEEDLLSLDGFAEKKTRNILDSIEACKTQALNNFIFALGIPYVGVNTSKNLAKEFGYIEAFMNATYEDLIAIDDIGEKTALAIQKHLKESRSIITELLAAGINPPLEVPETVGAALAGKTFVITGTLSVPREEIKALILQRSGRVTNTVTGKTDYLIAGSNVGATKTAKAESLGVKVILEEELLEMIGQ